MSRPGLALAATLAAGSLAFSQTPPAAPAHAGDAAPPTAPDLLAHLRGWAAVTKAAESFSAKCTVVKKNLVLKKETTFEASIECLKPNMVRLRLEPKPATGQRANPNDYEKYVCTGAAVYQYDGLTRTVTEYPLGAGGVGDNPLLALMSGALTAADVARRFGVKELRRDGKPDANYVFLELTPRRAEDRVEFETMVVVLYRPNIPGHAHLAYLPRTVVVRKHAGQEEEVWDFPDPKVNEKGIEPRSFRYEPIPDWKFQRAGTAGSAADRPKGP